MRTLDIRNKRILFHLFISISRSKRLSVSLSRLREIPHFPGSPGRTGPPTGLALAPGKGIQPLPTTSGPWSGEAPFSAQQTTAPSVISGLAHGHPARQGTRAGPWQQTWGLSQGQELLAEAGPAAPSEAHPSPFGLSRYQHSAVGHGRPAVWQASGVTTSGMADQSRGRVSWRWHGWPAARQEAETLRGAECRQPGGDAA